MRGRIAVPGKLLADLGGHVGGGEGGNEGMAQGMERKPGNAAARRAGAFARHPRIDTGGGHDALELHRQTAFARAALGRKPRQDRRRADAGRQFRNVIRQRRVDGDQHGGAGLPLSKAEGIFFAVPGAPGEPRKVEQTPARKKSQGNQGAPFCVGRRGDEVRNLSRAKGSFLARAPRKRLMAPSAKAWMILSSAAALNGRRRILKT